MKHWHLRATGDWSPFMVDLMKYRDAEESITVTVTPYQKRRSTQANAYYWSMCIPMLSEHFGYRPDEMHTVLLGTYTGWEERKFRDKTIYIPRRTSTSPDVMTVLDFNGLIETAQQIAAEEGIILPDQEVTAPAGTAC